MVYLVGLIGFFGGFMIGQMVLAFLLRHKKRRDLLEDDSLKWTYGLLNWAIAALGAYSFITLYHQYFD